MTCPKLVKSNNPVPQGPVVIVVMDGVGIGKADASDAVSKAKTPNLDRLGASSLYTELQAHGKAVGLPSDADMGNSEVGHNALGSGRVFDQGAKLVSQAIETGALFEGESWKGATTHVKSHDGALHFVGLLSDGNVHSHILHLIALLKRAAQDGVQKAFVHILLDGRDVPRTSAHLYIQQLEDALSEIRALPAEAKGEGREEHSRNYQIASGGGRMTTTMDRYGSDWSMVERGWQAHILGEAEQFQTPMSALLGLRSRRPGIGDQDLGAFVIAKEGKPVGPVEDGDAFIMFNFRGDRALEICTAFEDEAFDKFDRKRVPDVFFAGMTLYDGDTQTPKNFLVSSPTISCTLGELLADAKVGQFACSETQKFGHVTYFWNGNRSGYFDESTEKYLEVPSYAPPFDEKPQMRAPEITDALLEAINEDVYRFLRVNFANGDMVGHTGNIDAATKAVEAVDHELGRIVEKAKENDYALVLT
ncbi:2,3-bisphosphoglycerate-independent phosphoglycerate mutase, partial [Myxococcota bacterium]|nr:2,3-bisphosphoglycerate-independent phosphoglycerate mutase [Myxococcota bacterium]